ncbi:MAG TPA: hypothetical protein VEW28_03000 [Candidatus Kapabacteria bacterium]|nr:hypothetical protein [Candidatus Kapabacteria bacterium]
MSVPRVLLLHWNRGRWSANERPVQALTENACESWVFAFGGDFLNTTLAKPSDLDGYDIIIANSDRIHLEKLCALSNERPASCKWVTLIEGEALDYIKPRPHITELLNNSDLINCINKYTVEFFRHCTTAKVEYIGFPYPVDGIRALRTPKHQRRKEIFLAPMLLGRSLEYFTVKDLGIPYYGYEKKFSRTIRTIVPNILKHRSFDRMYYQHKTQRLYEDPQLRIEREEPLMDFFRRNGSAYVWLNMDPRYTWGRYILDAAALEVPIVATRSTGHAEQFFPKTMIETEFEVDSAASLVKRLFEDQDFYDEVASIPIEAFDTFRAEYKKKELMDALSL